MSGPQLQSFSFMAGVAAVAAVTYGLIRLWGSYTQPPESLFAKHSSSSSSSSPDGSDRTDPTTQQELAHLDPDTLSPHERQQLLEQFTLACEYMNSKTGKSLSLTNQDKLRFYAYFKTATVGPNSTPKPSLIDFERVAMWNAWYELNGTAKVEAMICYVEQLHRIDRDWRSKVTSKALERVLGENSTMVCDDQQQDSDDEDDKLFLVSRSKTREERDVERHSATKSKKDLAKENKQKLLKEKFTNIATHGALNAGLDSIHAAVSAAVENAGQEDSMGPVFSSSTRVEHSDKLQPVTITVGDEEGSGDVVVDDDVKREEHDSKGEDGDADVADDVAAADIVDLTTPIAASVDDQSSQQQLLQPKPEISRHCLTNGETILRVFMGEFHELTELDDLNLFQEVIETENIAAIVSKDPTIDPGQLKNDQELLFSFKVILVDVNRVTLLHQVAEGGAPPQCGILLHTFKYPIDLPDANGNTPLMVAIGNENTAMVKYLVAQGANVLAVSSQDGESVEDLISLCDDRGLKQFLVQAIAEAKKKQTA